MYELPLAIQKRIRRYKEIKDGGLVLYPVRVRDYDDFLIARPALEVLHQSLELKYMRMPLLSAMYAMDCDAAMNGGQPTGLFSRALLGLALSLRLREDQDTETRLKAFQIVARREKPNELVRVQFTDDDGNSREITPVAYQRLRQIIAAQNGVKLESEKANPAIVKANNDKANAGGISLDADPDELISAVAALYRTTEEDIDEWAILRLNNCAKSLERVLSYIVCGIGEMSGASWKGGNPVPHPFFPRAGNGLELAKLLDEEEEKKGVVRARNSDVQAIEKQIRK